MYKLRFILLLLLACTFSCSKDAGQSPSSAPMASVATQNEAFSAEPWLRDRLPADTIAYLRIPSPWRALFGPAGKTTDRMFESEDYVAAVSKLRGDMAKDALSGETAVPLSGLIYRLKSPIEIAVIATGKIASPATQVYVSLVLDYADAGQLATVLGQAFGDGQTLSFDADGYASLPATGAPGFIHFDASSKRVSILGGMFANLESLKTLRKAITDGKVEPRAELALEREIDAVGHGLVAWADIESLRPLLSSAATAPVARALLDQTKRIAFGWGSVGGQGRLSLRAEISGASWTHYLPQAPRKLDLTSSGTPRFVIGGAWPTADDVKRMQTALKRDANAEALKSWEEGEAKLIQATGLSLADCFSPFGPDWVVFADEAGDFLGLRLADAGALQKLLATLVDKLRAKYTTHQRAGQTIHFLDLPSALEVAQNLGGDAAALKSDAWMQIYARAGTQLYWMEQDGWLILSGVPQPLMDRIALGAHLSLGDYAHTAGGDPNALLSAAGVATDMASRAYYSWLGVLASVADVGGTQVDLLSLPTARELALPRETPLSANLHLSPTRLQVELNYGQHALEWLGGSEGLTMVAVAGVLAAIAIPAYDDFTMRSKVALGLAAASPLKLAIAEHFATTGELANDANTLGIDTPISTDDGSAQIDVENGAIIVRFADSAPSKLAGKFIYLLPAQNASGGIDWRCGNAAGADENLLVEMIEISEATDIDARYLPAGCR